MERASIRRAALAAAVLILTLAVPSGVAHAHGETATGDLTLTIGFAEEPAYAGLPNAAQIIVEVGGRPVPDLKGGDLQVEVGYGDETSEPMDLEPAFFFEGDTLVFGEAGDYHADFVPSQPGRYTFHVTGRVHGHEVDQRMTSGPDTFSAVEDLQEASFPPVEAPSNAELATRVEAEALRAADGVAAAEAAAVAAEDAASSARTVGLVGVVLGAIGVIAAVAALAASRRKA